MKHTRRILSLLLAAVLLMPLTAQAGLSDLFGFLIGNRSSSLDEAFASGAVTLRRKEIPGLPEGALPVSISPDGSTVIFRDPEEGLCVLRNGRARKLTRSEDRGVADEHGGGKRYMDLLERNFPTEEDTVWSKDGRYAVMTAHQIAMQQARFIDLMLLDCETAEIIQLTSFAKRLVEEGAGTVVQARFDRSGRYLYYTFYGDRGEHRVSLMRYDLRTGEHKMCCNTEQFIYRPNLWELSDGLWINLLDQRYAYEAGGLNVFSEKGGVWVNTPRYLTVSEDWTELTLAQFTPGGGMPYRFLTPTLLRYSEESGYAVALVENKTAAGLSALVRITPDEDFAGMDTYWCLHSLDQAKMDILSQADIQALADGSGNTMAQSASAAGLVSIRQFVLSPDGQYALLCAARNANEGALLLLRLEDMALCPVNLPGSGVSGSMRTALARHYAPGMIWNEDGRLFILDRDNDVGCYAFDVR